MASDTVRENTENGIGSMQVELGGHGAILTADDGSFRFYGVARGGYTLYVVGFGYAPRSRYVLVYDDVALTVPLEPAS